MKKKIFTSAFFLFFSSILCFCEVTIKKVYVDDGIIYFANAPEVSDAAVQLFVGDLHTHSFHQVYLPGTLSLPKYDFNRKSHIEIKFPLAWAVEQGKIQVIFPSFAADSLGRVTFRLWSVSDILNPNVQPQAEKFINENGVILYRGYWNGQPLAFMNSEPFTTNTITQENLDFWYDLSNDFILARAPISSDVDLEWKLKKPFRYRWIEYTVKSNQLVSFVEKEGMSEIPGEDINLIAGLKTQGKKILSDEGESLPTADWLVWGTKKGKPIILQVSFAEKSISHKEYFDFPKTILLNEDSNYVMLFFKTEIDLTDIPSSLKEFTNIWEKDGLLKKYPPRAEIESENQMDSPLLPAIRGQYDPVPPEEAERQRLEWEANRPREELFTSEELEALFSEPQAQADPLEKARAYDWAGKFAEALEEYGKVDSIQGRFELGMLLKYGRPGIPPDEKAANSIFQAIVLEVEPERNRVSGEINCLAGMACREFVPPTALVWERWRNRHLAFFNKAME